MAAVGTALFAVWGNPRSDRLVKEMLSSLNAMTVCCCTSVKMSGIKAAYNDHDSVDIVAEHFQLCLSLYFCSRSYTSTSTRSKCAMGLVFKGLLMGKIVL